MVILLVSLLRLLFGYAPITGCSLGVGGGGGEGKARKGYFVKDRMKVPDFPLLDGDTEQSKLRNSPPRGLSYLAIIPRARMGSESIAHEAEGRMGY